MSKMTIKEAIDKIKQDQREVQSLYISEDGKLFVSFRNREDTPDDVQIGQLAVNDLKHLLGLQAFNVKWEG